ncbi:receptor-interacting serine/threonine-protein kinase 3-like isoform X2 [Genypterus blacodes]|uniref:receptor-interacting serine/threonine-protein kinase 3-like isoform X2 n=1 Tax=Genypterus blacodes TaxID=154954 RepID=UPI003F76A884
MALESHEVVPIEENSMEKLRCGYGGFGSVFKAKHKVLQTDVAIKFLHSGSANREASPLLREAIRMKRFTCPFVVLIYGMYEGCPPGTSSVQLGIVMEFMQRGSIESLQHDLKGPPPWPLAFRFARDIATGMNYLHEGGFLHQDLKPSNVLLDQDFNAKIADFGLCRASCSVIVNSGMETQELTGGTSTFMPPEAFEKSYKPVRAFDIYSYGILLWYILVAEELYPDVEDNFVRCVVTVDKSRPDVKKIDQNAAEGLKDLVDLMQKCWHEEPKHRPGFKDFLKDTQSLFSKHETKMHDAIGEVRKKTDPTMISKPNTNPPPDPPSVHLPPSEDTVDLTRIQTGSSKKECVPPISGKMSNAKKEFVEDKMDVLVCQMSRVMIIVDALKRRMSGEDYDKIRAAEPDQEKVRTLYRMCLRTEMDKAAFYDVLMKHQKELMESLS